MTLLLLFALGVSGAAEVSRPKLPASPRSTQSVVEVLAPVMKKRFADRFRAANLQWPPKALTLLAFKRERRLEVWGEQGATRSMLAWYPILAASGHTGPKLREGDRQVPEGIYRLPLLNPNSQFHLSILIDYPNRTDLMNASPRTRMGGDVYIHGNRLSAGCIAIGDSAIEEVFTLCALTPPSSRRIIVAPVDLRRTTAPAASASWIRSLYVAMSDELRRYGGNRR